MPRNKQLQLNIPRLSQKTSEVLVSGPKQTVFVNGNSNNDQSDSLSVDDIDGSDKDPHATSRASIPNGTKNSSKSSTSSKTTKAKAKKIDLANRLVLPVTAGDRNVFDTANILPAQSNMTSTRAAVVSPVYIKCRKTPVSVNGTSSHQKVPSRMHSRFSLKTKKPKNNRFMPNDDDDEEHAVACDVETRNGVTGQLSTLIIKKTPVNDVKTAVEPVAKKKSSKAATVPKTNSKADVTDAVTSDIPSADDEPSANLLSSSKSDSELLPPIFTAQPTKDDDSSTLLQCEKAPEHQFAVPLPTDSAKFLPSRGVGRRKLPFKPSDRHVRREPVIASQYDPVVVPSFAAWFSFDAIHPLERRALPEFFNSVNQHSKNPKTYMHLRNLFVNIYRSTPCDYLPATAVRRMTGGDVCACLRIHAFLEQWGLINYQAGRLPPLEVQIQQLAGRAAERELLNEQRHEDGASSDEDEEVDGEDASEFGSDLSSRPRTPRNIDSRQSSPRRSRDTPTHRQSQQLIKNFLSRSSSSTATNSNANSVHSTPVSSAKIRAAMPHPPLNLHPAATSCSSLQRISSAPNSFTSSLTTEVTTGLDQPAAFSTSQGHSSAANVTESRKRTHSVESEHDNSQSSLKKHFDYLTRSCSISQSASADDAEQLIKRLKPLTAAEPESSSSIISPPNNAALPQRPASWTDNEKFRLVQGLHDFGEDWNRVARHVGRPTAECITFFMQLPIEDQYLKRWSLFESQQEQPIRPPRAKTFDYESKLLSLCGGSEQLSTLALFASIIDGRVVSAAVACAHYTDELVQRQMPTLTLKTALHNSIQSVEKDADDVDSSSSPAHVVIARRAASSLDLPWLLNDEAAAAALADDSKANAVELRSIFDEQILTADDRADSAHVSDITSNEKLFKAAKLLLHTAEHANKQRDELEKTVSNARADIDRLKVRKMQLQYEHYMQNEREYSHLAAEYELDQRLLICDRLRAAHEKSEARSLVARLQATCDLAKVANSNRTPSADGDEDTDTVGSSLSVSEAIALHIRKHKTVPPVPAYLPPSIVPSTSQQQFSLAAVLSNCHQPLFSKEMNVNAVYSNYLCEPFENAGTSTMNEHSAPSFAVVSKPLPIINSSINSSAAGSETGKKISHTSGKRNVAHETATTIDRRRPSALRKPSVNGDSSMSFDGSIITSPAINEEEDNIRSFL